MNKGFTLVEILIVVLILAFVALGIMALLPSGYQQATVAGRMSVMNHLGQQKIDQLKARGFNDPDLVAGTHVSVMTGELDGYSLKWVVGDDEVFASNVKTVAVTAGYMLHESDGSDVTPPNKFALRQTFITKISR